MNISPALEDYLEAILILQESQKHVRVKSLADFMQVKAPSVIDALSHLKQMGLIAQEPYGTIELTSRGIPLAQEIYGRHNTLKRFFREILGLEENVAEEDACKSEHYLSQKTIQRMLQFMRFIEVQPQDHSEMLSNFNTFIKESKAR